MRWYEDMAVKVEVRHVGGIRQWAVYLHYGDMQVSAPQSEVRIARYLMIESARKKAASITAAIEAAITLD